MYRAVAAGAFLLDLPAPLRAGLARLLRAALAAPLDSLAERDPETLSGDLADGAAVKRLQKGVGAVVHLGGVSV